MTTRRTAATRYIAQIEKYGPQVTAAKLTLRAAGYRVLRCGYDYSLYQVYRNDETWTTDVWGLLEMADKVHERRDA